MAKREPKRVRKFRNVAYIEYDPKEEKALVRTRHGKHGDLRKTHSLEKVTSLTVAGDITDAIFSDSMHETTKVAVIGGNEYEFDQKYGTLVCLPEKKKKR